jgi:hypothetical protein
VGNYQKKTGLRASGSRYPLFIYEIRKKNHFPVTDKPLRRRHNHWPLPSKYQAASAIFYRGFGCRPSVMASCRDMAIADFFRLLPGSNNPIRANSPHSRPPVFGDFTRRTGNPFCALRFPKRPYAPFGLHRTAVDRFPAFGGCGAP